MATSKKVTKAGAMLAGERREEGLGVSRGLTTFLVLFALAAGLYAVLSSHTQVYPVSEETPWAILGSTCALFASAGTGLFFIAITACVFGGNSLTSFVNRALFLSIASACATGGILLIHFAVTGGTTQSPMNLILRQIFSFDLFSQILYPESTSNVWWIRTLMSGTFGSMLVMFYANATGQINLARLVGAFGGLAALGANMSLGALVSNQVLVRPLWYGGGQLGLYFIFSSVMAGAATYILLTYLAGAIGGTGTSTVKKANTLKDLELTGQVLSMSTFAVLVVTAWRFATALMDVASPARPTADVLVHGLLSANFWGFEVIVGLALPVLLLATTRDVTAMVAASAMVLVGVVFQRYDLLIAGRLIPVELEWHDIGMALSYLPSVAELLLVASGIGLVGAMLLLGEWMFGPDFRYSEG